MLWKKNEVDIRIQSLDKLHVAVAVLDTETHCEKQDLLVSMGNLKENYNI